MTPTRASWLEYPKASGRWRASDTALVIGVMLVAAVLDFYGLGRESLWLDEATTFHRARMPLGDLVRDTTENFHVPTYFVLLHYWIRLGDSEAMLRAPSAVFGVASVGMCFVFGRVAGNRFTGACAAFLMALSPFHIMYAQEARMYSLLSFATIIAMTGALWLFVHPTEAALPIVARAPGVGWRPSPAARAWLLCGGGLTAALYLHNISPFFGVAIGTVALHSVLASGALRLKLLRNWGAVGGGVAVLYAPWAVVLARQVAASEGQHWGKVTVGVVARGVSGFFALEQPYLIVVGGSLVLLAIVSSIRSSRREPFVLLAFVVIPIGIALAFSTNRALFSPRTLIGCSPPAHVLVALGLTQLTARVAALPLATLIVSAVLRLQSFYATEVKEGWRDALALIEARWQPGALVLAIGGREERQIRYYYERTSSPFRARPLALVTGEDAVARARGAKKLFSVALGRRRSQWKGVLRALESDWEVTNQHEATRLVLVELRPRPAPR